MTGTASDRSITPRSPTIPSDLHDASSQGQARLTGLFMSSDHRYWMNGEGPMPSVTTILRVLDKPALTYWYKKQVAEAAYNRVDEWQKLGQAEAVKWLMSMPDATRDTAAGFGTALHGLVDSAGRSQEGVPVPEGYQEAFAGFQAFLERCGGSHSIVSSEKAILNLSEGYAGTFDLLMHIDSQLWLIDVKSGKGVYPDYALQLAGYGMAEHIALPGDPTLYPFPEPARYGVPHPRPGSTWYCSGRRCAYKSPVPVKFTSTKAVRSQGGTPVSPPEVR